jgi:hypothetical protein
MNRLTPILAALLTFSCAAYTAQKQAADPQNTQALDTIRKATVDPEITKRFEEQPLAVKQAVVVSELDHYIEELKAQGKYDCCVKPSCRQCAINAGECHCRRVIDASGPCCGECTQSWVEGRGNTAGIDREAVLQHLGCIRELYDKAIPEGMTAPGSPVAPKPEESKPKTN